MKSFFPSLRDLPFVRVILAVFLGAVLLLSTACNPGNEVGARPNNPPVQMGGQNNPHKAGGDDYTEFNTDRRPVQNPTEQRQASRPAGYWNQTHKK